MALVTCTECGREISDQAVSCPGCGAAPNAAKREAPKPKRSSRAAAIIIGGIVVVVAVVGIEIATAPNNAADPETSQSICSQSAQAAHYIAAESANNPGGVVAVTGDLVAKDSYPALGDKLLAHIGAAVAADLKVGKTPAEISADVRSSCKQ